MQAIAITRSGPPEVLEPVIRPDPVPGPGEVLIRVGASGINRPDVLQRKGLYPPPAGASDLPGLEVAGTLIGGDEVAMAAAGLHLGDRVCALLTGGGYAELAVAPVDVCLPVPTGFSDVQAAALPETFFTVWSNVFDRARLQPGEWLLVHGGSSGIGVAAIQLARAFGARVAVTAGSDAKCEACRALGADHAVNYRRGDFVAEMRELTAARGVDVILDMVAGDYLERDIDCLADDGRIVVIAVQGGVQSRINTAAVLVRRLTITGSTLRPRPVSFKAAIARQLRERVWPLLEQGCIAPVIDRVFPAAEAAEAHRRMEAGEHIGKLLLTWS